MSLVKIAAFVVTENKNKKEVKRAFHELLDGFVVRQLSVFDSGLKTTHVEDVENAAEVLEELSETDDDD